MPTYEYRCRDCGRDFDVFQRMSDPPSARCPACGRAAERLISGGAGLLFKGEGFYITDHRSDDYRKQAREGSSQDSGKSDAGADKSAGGGGDSAPSDGGTAAQGG